MLNLEIVGQGARTTVYREGGTAIKLYIDAPHGEAENEAERQRFAVRAGLPVPVVFGVRRVSDNAVALEMEHINGVPLFAPRMDKDERARAIQILAELQCVVHQVVADGQPRQADRYEVKINQNRYLDKDDKAGLSALLHSLDTGCENLCHGDFHPLNILFDGEKHWIIDWVDATAGNPLADACRTYLIFRQFMQRSAGIYLRAFCKEAAVKQEDVLAWLPVIAAVRLGENVDNKTRTWLMELTKSRS